MSVSKGVFAGILLAAITTNTISAAIIDEPLKEEVLTDTSKRVTISGTVPLVNDNNAVSRIVTLEVLTKDASRQILESSDENKYELIDKFVLDKNKIEYIAQTEADENGDYSFEYTKNSESGDYIIRIGYYANNDENEYVMTYSYKSPEDLVSLYDEISQAYAGKDSAELKNILVKYSEMNVISIEAWDDLCAEGNESAIQFVLSNMLERKAPETEEEIRKYIDEAILLENFNGKTTEEIKASLEDTQKRSALGIDETVYTWFISEENDKAAQSTYKKLAGNNFQDMTVETMRNHIHFTMIIEEMNNVLWAEILKVIENNNTILKIDLSEYNDLGNGEKDKALSGFKTEVTKAENLEDIKEIFDEQVEDAGNQGGNSSGGSTGGSTGGSSGGSSDSRKPDSGGSVISYPSQVITGNTQNNESDENNSQQTTEYAFNDLEGVAWAAEAIARLKEKGVISGTGDGNFQPQNPVTREEFLKMVIEALGLRNRVEDVTFTDVDTGSWYYPYICGGVYYQLINGMEDGSFGVGQSIKRADVAVILVRLLAMYGKEYTWKSIVFKDVLKEELEYAYDAIYSVAEAKLMTGTGDVTFEPLKSLTRAEAAVIIDRAMTLLENN